MEFQRNEQLEEDVLDEMMGEISDDRTHPSLTDLLYCLTKTWRNANQPLPVTRKTKMYYSIGLGLERNLLVKRHAVNLSDVRGQDGIGFHPDSFTEDAWLDGDRLVEMKGTRYGLSTKGRGEFTPEHFPENWHKQAMGYCYKLKVNKVSFIVLHIIQAELRTWDIEYTDLELMQNWAQVMLHKEVWDIADQRQEAPESYAWNQEWECKDCIYSLWCQARVKK